MEHDQCIVPKFILDKFDLNEKIYAIKTIIKTINQLGEHPFNKSSLPGINVFKYHPTAQPNIT